jgi:hypothetical protein
MSLNNRKFLIWKEREREKEGGGQVGQQARIFKVRLGLGEKKGERQRYRDTER